MNTSIELRKPPYRVARARLSNGLRLLTIETPHLHTASVCLYVRAGSRYETPRDERAVPFPGTHVVSRIWPLSQLVRAEPRDRRARRDAVRRDRTRLLALPDHAAPEAGGARAGNSRRPVLGAGVPRHRPRTEDRGRGDPGGPRRSRPQRERRRSVAQAGVGTPSAGFPDHGADEEREALLAGRRARAFPALLRRRQHGS